MLDQQRNGMFEMIRSYIPEYRHYRGKLVIALLAMLMVAGASAAIAWMMKPLLDEIFINRNTDLLYVLPLVIILIYLVKGVGSFTQEYLMSFVGQDIVRKVRDHLLSHMLLLDIAFFYQHHTGELISRITADITRIQNAVSTSLAGLMRESLTALALIGVVIYQSPMLSFITLVVLPAAYYPVSLLARRLKRISHRSQEQTSRVTANLSEMFSNV